MTCWLLFNLLVHILTCSDLPRMPWSITADDYAKRADLRDYNICSIDPPGWFPLFVDSKLLRVEVLRCYIVCYRFKQAILTAF